MVRPPCTEVHLLIHDMFGAISTLTSTKIPHPSLRSQLKLLCKLNGKVQAGLSGGRGDDFYSTAPHQPLLVVNEHVALFTALIPQLRRFGDAAATDFAGGVVEDVFWQLWLCLRLTACAMYAWQHTSISRQLWTPLQTLLSWLLSITRSPAWLGMPPGHVQDCRNHELLLILRLPMWCLRVISDTQEPETSLLYASLPPDYVTMLCCVACEHLEDLSDSGHQPSASRKVNSLTAAPVGAPALESATPAEAAITSSTYICHPSSTPTYQRHGKKFDICSDMTVVMTKSIQQRRLTTGPDTQVHAVFKSSAVLQVARLLLVRATRPSGNPDDLCFLAELNTFLITSIWDDSINRLRLQNLPHLSTGPLHVPAQPHSAAEAATSLTPTTYMTDSSLLRLLCSIANSGGPWTAEWYRLVGMICQCWCKGIGGNGLPLPGPNKDGCAVSGSLCSLARQCGSHTLRWMQAMRVEQLRQRRTLHAGGVVLPQAAELSSSNPADAQPYLFSQDTMGCVQLVTLLVCQISIQTDMEHILGARGDPDKDSGKDYTTLTTWITIPGCLAVLEAVLRDEHQPGEVRVALLAGAEASKILSITFHARGIVRLGLAATLRKVLYINTSQCVATAAIDGSGSSPGQQQLARNWEMQVALTGNEMAPLLDMLSQPVGYRPLPTWQQQQHKDDRRAGQQNSGHLGDDDSLAPSSKAHAHQLQAIALASLVQVCRARINVELEQGVFVRGMPQPPWMDRPMLNLQAIPYSDLKLMVSSVLEELLCADVTEREVNRMWEGYAVRHFHGRLLPGCCNMSCDNLDGVCEQGLQTLLCGGCRRTRYCCVECQRAAWVEGGHSRVCGKLQENSDAISVA